MGTVRGDLHDIGKNLVCMMAEGAGFEVHDIGVDQNVDKFLAKAREVNPTIVGMSALLTTTMTYMKTVIDGFEAAGLGHVKMAVGGAPISQMFADEIGADGYGQNASAAVDLFLRLAGAAPESAAVAAETQAAVGPAAANGGESGGASGRVTRVSVLRWQEIPTQIKAEDDAGNLVSIELAPKFAQRIDQVAQRRGFTDADAYLAQWRWSEGEERAGSAAEVAEAVRAELEAQADW
jgi:cobalamin-dependent methionine synthase I